MSILKSLGFVFFCIFSINAFATVHGKYFDRVITVIFENKNYSDVLRQPFFSQLAKNGAHFSNFMGLVHPSQPNYIALTSGSLQNVKNDLVVNLDVTNVIDLLEAQGISWKIYAEDYPGNCFTGVSKLGYARKHNPFISYMNIQKNPSRCANIVNASEFDQDAENNALAQYVFYIPNNKNNGHDTDLSYADKWFSQKFSKYVSNNLFMEKTILVSTFDESEPKASINQIYTSIVGSTVKPAVYSDALNAYSVLKLIEDNWSLGNLGREDVKASPVPNIW